VIRPTIIVFAKAPVAGRVKTRLRLPPGEAARLHDRFVRAAVLLCLDLDADVELHTDEPTGAWADLPVRRGLQVPGDLGAKMLAALRSRSGPVMIVGSDAPTLPAGHLRRLLASPADVALGPTEDGGYYAILARRTADGMFEGVEWSSGRELEQTIRAAKKAGLSVETGDVWFDVDTPEDLRRVVW